MSDPANLQQTIFLNGQDYFSALLSDIYQAQHSILLETYIYSPDSVGETIAKALLAARERNVQVQVLIDGAGSPLWGGQIAKQLEQAGVQTRIFHPFPWSLWQWSRSHVKTPALLKAIYLLLKINSRNHRKVCVIDDKIAYIGSFNISKVHLSQEEGGDNWRDTAVRIEGINLNELIRAFNSAWEHNPIQERIQNIFRTNIKHPIIRINNTRFRRRTLYRELLHRISQCKSKIWMTNAYFIPDNFLLKHLSEAANRGVDVRILLPKKSDIFFMPWASSIFYLFLLKTGVRVFEYLPSMLHAKSLILDDWMIVGSSNLNHRSLLHDLEVDVEIRDPEAKIKIEQAFLADLANSEELSVQQWYLRPRYQRIFGNFFLYLKYWI